MGWSIGYDSNWKRDIGYGVPAWCDQPGCEKEIDRGLSYVCGAEPYGGERGCGLYFCSKHLSSVSLCVNCELGRKPFELKPDHPDWVHHKATDPSWAAALSCSRLASAISEMVALGYYGNNPST